MVQTWRREREGEQINPVLRLDNSIDRLDNKNVRFPVRHVAISVLIIAPATVSVHRRRHGARMTPGLDTRVAYRIRSDPYFVKAVAGGKKRFIISPARVDRRRGEAAAGYRVVYRG